MNLKEFQERDRQLLAMSGIPERPKGGRRSPNTKATGGTRYGVIMIPRTFRGPRTSTKTNSATSLNGVKPTGSPASNPPNQGAPLGDYQARKNPPQDS